jgi:hypothetical protein
MIISHEHRFIFVKSRKTGGTSVEIALSRFAGPDDVVTPITPRDEILRLKSGARCQNFANDLAIEHRYLEELRGGDVAALPRYITEGQKYANHMTLADILRQVDRSVEGYKIVSVERHPYDKAVSLSNFLLGYRGYIAGGDLEASLEAIRAHIDELIASGKMREKIRNWDLYTLDGDYRVDHMLQHQDLQDDFHRLLGALDLPAFGVELPVTKRGHRDRTVPAREVLTSGQRVAIQAICAEEFEFFNYEK